MSRVQEVKELTRIRILSFLREPEAVFWVFVFPMVLAAVLGFAFRSGSVKPSIIGVVGESPIAERLRADETIDVRVFEDQADALVALRKGKVDGLVEPTGEGTPPRFTFDPVRADSTAAELRVQRAVAEVPEDVIAREELKEKGSRYVDFLFPGLLGMNLMGTGMWGIGFAIADVRRRKFLKRLLVTPMRKSSFFLGFIFSRLAFLVLEMTVLVTFGAVVLGVPFRGDALSFIVLALLGAAVFAGVGILIASRARTIEGVSGLMNLVMMPMWLTSGVFFSYERFPEAIHPVLRMLPLTALNDAMRAVLLDGESIFGQAQEVVVMIVWCIASFLVALKIFRWS
ncbi:MAG: ABC transporter permease [Phycisphaerales bacterium]|nr:ABC transporter permease [Phycisphaerales bacterium]